MENLVIFIGTPVYSMQGIYASEALFSGAEEDIRSPAPIKNSGAQD